MCVWRRAAVMLLMYYALLHWLWSAARLRTLRVFVRECACAFAAGVCVCVGVYIGVGRLRSGGVVLRGSLFGYSRALSWSSCYFFVRDVFVANKAQRSR